MFTLRPDQVEDIDGLREAMLRGARRLVLVKPTGSGKTVVASEMIRRAVERGHTPVLFCAFARELVKQASRKLEAFGVRHATLMAGERFDPYAPVIVASAQTIHSRVFKLPRDHPKAMDLPNCRLIFEDEAHRWGARTAVQIGEALPGAFRIGLTATPARPSGGLGMGDVYDVMVQGGTYAHLIEIGALVPTRVMAPSRLDLSGVQVTGGEYNQRQLAARMDKRPLVGRIYEHWASHASDRKTVIFATGIQHSLHIVEEFHGHGVAIEHLDGETSHKDRDQILWRLKHGDLRVVSNCDVLTEGWDEPSVSCCVLAKPTKSIVKYRQMAGRISRPFDGKVDALILDHSGNVFEHGFPDEDIEWTLTKGKERATVSREAREPFHCPACGAVFTGRSRVCVCGREVPGPKPRKVFVKDGLLGEVKRWGKPIESEKLREREWRSAIWRAIKTGKTIGAAGYMYEQRTGAFPRLVKHVPLTAAGWKEPARLFWDRTYGSGRA